MSNPVGRFFNFDEFITDKFIKVIFIVSSVLVVLGVMVMSLISVFTALKMSRYGGSWIVPALMILGWPILGVIEVFLIRIWCEVIIVVFKINANIQKIADRS